jgi:CubicO group peptidase (beta-lactamase class C family)
MPPVTEVTEDALTGFNSTETRLVPVPGGGGIMSAATLALFYQGLLNGCALGGKEIWRKQTLDTARTVRNNYPDLMGIPVNRALGVVIAGDEHRNARGFGHTNSPLAFGHGGAGGQIAWADPVTGISLGYCTSGHDRNVIRQARRGIGISSRAASCAA